jgi:hypothetical protein
MALDLKRAMVLIGGLDEEVAQRIRVREMICKSSPLPV